MSRAEALERYNALSVPDTTEEHWRFTDLSGFDPDAFEQGRGQTPDVAVPSMLALDVSAEAIVTETGIEITRAPAEIRFEPLDESHERLGELVGWQEDKFAAHNAAAWQHGLLVHVPGGLELERPLFIRVVNAIEGGSLFWRLLVIAEEGSRFSLVEEHSSASPDLHGYFNGVAELYVEQAAKLEYVSLQNLSRETWHFASHHARVERDAELDWVSRRLRLQARQGADPERSRRPGRHLARDRRLLRRRRAAPRLRHLPGAHRARHRVGLRLQGRPARPRRPRSGAG